MASPSTTPRTGRDSNARSERGCVRTPAAAIPACHSNGEAICRFRTCPTLHIPRAFVVRRLARTSMNASARLLLLCLMGLLCSCAASSTKSWHKALNRPLLPSVNPGTPAISDSTSAQLPPRGPHTSWAAVRRVRVGMSGKEIHSLTGSYPFHAGDFAFLTTYHSGQAYEVAFRHSPDGTARIISISYLPVTAAQAGDNRD